MCEAQLITILTDILSCMINFSYILFEHFEFIARERKKFSVLFTLKDIKLSITVCVLNALVVVKCTNKNTMRKKEATVNSHAVSEEAWGPVASFNNDAKFLFKTKSKDPCNSVPDRCLHDMGPLPDPCWSNFHQTDLFEFDFNF